MAFNQQIFDILQNPEGVFLASNMRGLLYSERPHTFVLEHPLAHDGEMNAFRSQILLPFLLKKEAYTLLEPVLDEAREPIALKDIIHVYPKTRPPIFNENNHDLSPYYRTVRIFHSIPTASQDYLFWLAKNEKVKGDFWKKTRYSRPDSTLLYRPHLFP